MQVDEVGREVQRHDRARADEHGAGEIALRVFHLPTDEREIAPAVVGPEDRHHREQEGRQPHGGPLGQHGTGREPPVAAAQQEAQQHQRHERAHFQRRAHVLENRRAMDAHVVHHGHHADKHSGQELLGAHRLPRQGQRRRRGVESQDPQGVCRRRDGDRPVGAGADDQQLPPPEQERGERAERLANEHIDAARAREHRGELGIGERAAQRHRAPQHPAQQEQWHVVHALGDRGGGAEDAAADRRADDDRHGAPETESARQAVAPVIERRRGGHGCDNIRGQRIFPAP